MSKTTPANPNTIRPPFILKHAQEGFGRRAGPVDTQIHLQRHFFWTAELLENDGRIHDLEYESLYYIYIVYKLYIYMYKYICDREIYVHDVSKCFKYIL